MNGKVSLTKVMYALLIALAAVFIFQALELPPARESADIGPSFYPLCLAVLIIVFAIADLFVSAHIHVKLPARELLLALGTGAVMLSAIWLSTVFGLFYVLPVAAFVTLWIAGSKRWAINAVYSVVFTGLLWALFDQLLGIPLHQL